MQLSGNLDMLPSKFTEWLTWPLIRAHLCTLAVAMTFNSTWRVPRAAFLYGALPYGLLLTAALLVLALPVTLLQLAVGQLSQQDAVGVWRAVPFFRGVGHIRIIISFLGSTYSSIYLALAVAYFLYTATHDIPFPDCLDWIEVEEEEIVYSVNASQCLSDTFLSPVRESPQYYLAVALIVVVLWIISPFVFYNPVKLMKRILYITAPVVAILGIVIASSIGDGTNLSSFNESNWLAFGEPHLWASAMVQALWSNQVAGGFIISAGDSIYASTNVQWSAVTITCMNIISTWFWLIFWFLVSGSGVKDTSVTAVLVQTYQAAEDGELPIAWPILVFLTLILSGVITMLVLLYPIFDRIRRVGGAKWRVASFTSAVIGAGVTLAILAGSLPVITLVDDVALPLVVCVATVMEILAFGFIYGWSNLIEDVEFLIGTELAKYWVWGWWITPAVLTPIVAWWLTIIFLEDVALVEQPWQAATVLATVVVIFTVFVVCAAVAVGRQVQYDIFGKLKSSFQPTRHWGPRDPITHYYWLARRDVAFSPGPSQTRYNRRELGQLSRRPSFLTTESMPSKDFKDVKIRSNSDDWLYTTHRKIITEASYISRKRSKSLDWDVPRSKSREVESNNNTIAVNRV